MCFNEQVSLGTYIIGLIGVILLYKNNYIPEAIFYAWVIQMQLIEYFLWKNQPCQGESEEINKKISVVGIIVNHLEPIVLWIAVLLFGKKLPKSINMLMLGFVIATVLYTKNSLDENECTTVTPESSPHLFWKWNKDEKTHGAYYLYFLIALVVLSLYGLKENGMNNAVIIFLSFILSIIIYGKKHTVGAMWCFAAAFGPFILLFLNKYKP